MSYTISSRNQSDSKKEIEELKKAVQELTASIQVLDVTLSDLIEIAREDMDD